ncbi:hypothetical protein I7I53_02174 [Histoplasma capsulatum var. duboisii H88]|uniref:Uncharacterized protein n=1 Tax=Ajellomyces capsulatus (strain H88) TaxID=544711 RepID=A0A8A1LQ80_AJEC8|nr:hypothetical protein I7I53_02174 [Histoplasma capsulatum var. duboisii H88]
MPKGIHMLIDRMLGAELPGASLTFVYRCPVIGVVHVLVASTLAIECTGACLTFVHFGQVSMFMDCTYMHVYVARYGGIRKEVSGSREGWFLVEAERSMRPPMAHMSHMDAGKTFSLVETKRGQLLACPS